MPGIDSHDGSPARSAPELSELDPIEVMRRVVQLADATAQDSLDRAGFDGLTRSQAVVLLLLDEGFTTPSALRTELQVTQQFVSKCLRILAEDGCVELVGDPRDKRRRGVTMTQRGRRGVALIRARRNRMLSVVPDELGEQAMDFLERLLVQTRGEAEGHDLDV